MIQVDKKGVTIRLKDWFDYDYQKVAWLASSGPIVSSLDEDFCQLFIDTQLGDAMDAGQTIFGEPADQALRNLEDAIAKVDSNRPPQEILDDPLMQIVREKAAEALRLIREQL